jgi:CRISPR-associated endonuclease/helicase Cas3
MSDSKFAIRFERLTGHRPFPWQSELFESWFARGEFPASCNLPTGLGKTSLIAIWLIALADDADKVPPRLVYVVNRRTVVDQTTDEVERMRKNLMAAGLFETLLARCALPLGNGESPLAVSTLRGQFADNREWAADPARPAVICGTVDMIGSRLLFNGYRTGFKAKPLHAGFLGQGALLIHDEAHLEPAFQELLVAIEKEQAEGERTGELPWSKLRVIELTATSRRGGADTTRPFELTDAEKNPPAVVPDPPTEPVHHVWRRQKATKTIRLHEVESDEKLASEVLSLALRHRDSGGAVLVFVRRVEDAEKVAKGLPANAVEQLTGTLRGLERDRLVTKPIFQRFLPLSNRSEFVVPTTGTAYLVCTSAGEVGVNISADHMVCDLSTFESMTQRFGRVNRFGDRDDTRIDVVHPKAFGKRGKSGAASAMDEIDVCRSKTLELLKEIVALNGDVSPKSLGQLDPNAYLAAFAPAPTILPATDILFDCWALTTIRDKFPGRPPVDPYLHGISWQPPDTHVAWREEVEVITGDLLERYKPEDLLEEYPVKPHELLRDRSDRVFKHLEKIAVEHPEATVWLVDARDRVEVTTLEAVCRGEKDAINDVTILLPPCVGGLTPSGTLDGGAARRRAEDSLNDEPTGVGLMYDVADEWYEDEDRRIHRRRRLWDDDPLLDSKSEGMRFVRPPINIGGDAEETGEVPGPRYWYWYSRPQSADDDLTRTFTTPITWDRHTEDVTANIDRIAKVLRLPLELQRVLNVAARLHDLGKKREVWQRSIGNPNPTAWHAKSGRPWKPRDTCPDYRHEFGSLVDLLLADDAALSAEGFADLSEEARDLALHLIAAHHGRARPHFPTNEAFDPEGHDRIAAAIAIETPRRFARLQRRYGRWGLAYLESLLRAADWAASAKPSGFAERQERGER